MTASERLLAAWAALWARFADLGMTGVAIDVGLSGLAVVAAWGALLLARRLIAAGVRRIPGRPTAEKKVSTSRLARLLERLAGVAALIGALAAIGEIWGLHAGTAAAAVLGAGAAAALPHLLVLLALALVAFEVAGLAISQVMGRMARGERRPRRKAQLKTIEPLLKGLAQTVIVVVAALSILGQLGIDVAPLLAGAGVAGIAIGFGAQSLVKDLLTGVFLVVEDIVSVGDIVRIGDSGGLVERMTLRTIRLRDFDGTLHVLPYGEAQVVHNLTKSFAYAVFDLQISYSSDIDRALELMREVGAEMQRDPAFAEMVIAPIEVVGVDGLGESAVLLKARFKTRPLDQWSVGREYNRRIKLAFDREGVEIPFPHMKVVLPEAQLDELARH
jgi:small conductance mechanosensitive channel